ncbi:hypothetical protein IMCC14465_14940 [alpha proteobacterium IMCC14465]|uniref:DUF2062 domain-containing protein n=1 Tax=alpha proteobacterium IMCC14465 TaxID=1220535 RepID=J9DUR9_9PROT|nr:hypothetical protein IMCC14465_14940 [alpha proteobacterium IMCC14465]
MFKRRRPLDSLSQFREWIWPRAGWYRATQYILHRLLRLKGDGHSVALGLAIGAGVSASPIMGTHFVTAALLAWFFGGNIIASALGTWVGNPFTFPFIWLSTFKTGNFLLGRGYDDTAFPVLSLENILKAPLETFSPIIVPMTIGAIPVGVLIAVLTYIPTNILIDFYKKKKAARAIKKKIV